MKFQHDRFVCDVDIFALGDDVVARFYDADKEHSEDQIVNYVQVDPGFGYLCLKFKGEGGLLSGFLDESVFNEELVEAAIEFVEGVSPLSGSVYLPHHVDLFKRATYVEYNGEV